MSTRAALVSGTALSAAVTAAWSLSATATIGPAAPLSLTSRDLPGDYAQLATAATGSTWPALLAVMSVIYALCFLASGLRVRARARSEASRDIPQLAHETEPCPERTP